MRLLDRLLGRPAPAAPLDERERTRLEHRRRVLERQVRHAQKALDRHACSSCVQKTDPVGVALARRARLLEEELGRVEARLAGRI